MFGLKESRKWKRKLNAGRDKVERSNGRKGRENQILRKVFRGIKGIDEGT